MSGSVATSSARSAGSSPGASHTATSTREASSPRRDFHTLNGTTTGGATSSIDAASRTSVQLSSTIARSLMSRCGINAFLEGVEADAVHGVDEALVLVTVVDVGVDKARDHVRHLMRSERGSDDLAERRVVAL